MATTDNQRPGVYSRYDTASGYASPRSARFGAVVAKSAAGRAGVLGSYTGYGQALEELGGDDANEVLLACVKILLDSGVSRVLAAGAGNGSGYAQALALVEPEDVGAVVFDGETAAELRILKEWLERNAEEQRERIAFGGVGKPEEALAAARAVNCERVVLCCPEASPRGRDLTGAVYGACALAGKVLAANDPVYNWAGEALGTLEKPVRLPEGTIQELLRGGVTVLEQSGEDVECIRPVTTRITTGGEEDLSLKSLNTILIIDDVITAIRGALRRRLRGLRMSAGHRESIRSQVAVELAAKADGGIIEDFGSPIVYADSADPTVCVVELSFQVAHVVNQIHVTAHVQI